MELFNNHKRLFLSALALFILLTLIMAIMPALYNQEYNAILPNAVPLSDDALKGKEIYIANGCVACHTQQVRNVDMDNVWGDRPSIAADYAANKRTDLWRNTATLMGTERTGPDLTNIGKRQPSLMWHLLHLYQPRATVEKSIMPAYPWLFEEKTSLGKNDIEIILPDNFSNRKKGKIVATKEALQLVAYLQSLKQTELPDGSPTSTFLYKKIENKKPSEQIDASMPDGETLYTNNCMSCHQANGEGLKGAFPPLKNSPVVIGDNLELYVTIIMQGYDPRPEYATMNAVGTDNNLTAEEVTAIINHERTSWGNNAKKVTIEQVKNIIEKLKLTPKK